MFVAVTEGGADESFNPVTGRLLTSMNGTDWSEQTLPLEYISFTDVAFGGGRFVTTGLYYGPTFNQFGTTLFSSNGTDWTGQSFDLNGSYSASGTFPDILPSTIPATLAPQSFSARPWT